MGRMAFSPPPPPPPVPAKTWQHVTPAAAGFDGAELQHLSGLAEQGKSTCLIVARDGKLVAESDYRKTGPNSVQDIYSATKSIASILVGIAQDEGKLDVDDAASTWIAPWRGTPSSGVTVRDLLSNDSGRQWSPQIDYQQLLGAPDRTAFAVGLSQTSAPGTVWAYNNSAVQTLEQVLRTATGEDVAKFAQGHLFGPLGMSHTKMAVDRSGHAQLFEGVRSTCRDLARFGTLMVDGGRWGKRQVVSKAWVRAATGAPSQNLNAAYGLLWWLNRPGTIAEDPLVATDLSAATDPQAKHGQVVAGAPSDLYWALGLGNQVVQVDPGSGTVVVRLGTAERPKPPTFGPVQAAAVVTKALRQGHHHG
jgi:CubicO group peptidase (beta-lactamase class C family)